jgi:hypothetical protein
MEVDSGNEKWTQNFCKITVRNLRVSIQEYERVISSGSKNIGRAGSKIYFINSVKFNVNFCIKSTKASGVLLDVQRVCCIFCCDSLLNMKGGVDSLFPHQVAALQHHDDKPPFQNPMYNLIRSFLRTSKFMCLEYHFLSRGLKTYLQGNRVIFPLSTASSTFLYWCILYFIDLLQTSILLLLSSRRSESVTVKMRIKCTERKILRTRMLQNPTSLCSFLWYFCTKHPIKVTAGKTCSSSTYYNSVFIPTSCYEIRHYKLLTTHCLYFH